MSTGEKMETLLARVRGAAYVHVGDGTDRVMIVATDRDELCNRLEATGRIVIDHGDGTSTSLPAVPAPSPASVDVGEARKLADQAGLTTTVAWGVWEAQMRATVRSLSTALEMEQAKVKGLEGEVTRVRTRNPWAWATADRVEAAEALAREAGLLLKDMHELPSIKDGQPALFDQVNVTLGKMAEKGLA